jgi:hypothetical protein
LIDGKGIRFRKLDIPWDNRRISSDTDSGFILAISRAVNNVRCRLCEGTADKECSWSTKNKIGGGG